MKLHVWTNETSFLAVAHADSVAEARELLANEVGSCDGSCPEREHAWKIITENTSAPYVGRVAAFCLSASAEASENLSYAEKVVADRDTLRAQVDRLSGELAASAKTIADANRASDYALDVMRLVLGRRDVHGIEEGADEVAKLVEALRGELAAAKEDASKAWGEFRALSVRAGENYHNLRMRFGAIEDRAARWEERFLSAYNLLRTTLRELGGVAEPGASLEFLSGVPAEAAAVVKRLRETEAHAAELLEVLEAGKEDRWAATSGSTEKGVFVKTEWVIQAERLLTRTPAQSLADIQARALREAAERISTMPERMGNAFGGITREDVRREVLMMAERLEKEATDATNAR